MTIRNILESRTAWWVRAASLQLALCIAGTCGVGSTPAGAADRAGRLVGPVEARVMRIIDGDTIVVRAAIWPGQHIDVSVRLAGIDAPELRSRCPEQRNRAWQARNRLHNMIAGTIVHLHDVRHGKYAGRVVARVQTRDGVKLSAELVKAGLAYRYSKRRRRHASSNSKSDCSPHRTHAAATARP